MNLKGDRDFGLDVVRVTALICIMACHFMSVYNGHYALLAHDVFAAMGNSMFFVLSGFLLGEKWRAMGCPEYGLTFLAKRIKKLYPSFACFVVIYCVILWCKGVKLTGTQIFMNFTMLSWFSRLPGAGHLWFVTGIVMAYFFTIVLSRIRFDEHSISDWWVVVTSAFFVAMAFTVQCIGTHSAYYILLIGGFVVAFLFNHKIQRLWPLSLVFVLLVCFHDVETFNVLFAIIVAIAIIPECKRRFSGKTSPLIAKLGSISYELYLVHCIFQNTAVFNFRRFCGNELLFAVNYITCSILSALLLRQLSGVVKTCFNLKTVKREVRNGPK